MGRWLHDRWRVGYEPATKTPSHPAPSKPLLRRSMRTKVKDAKTDSEKTPNTNSNLVPVHERHIYRVMCKHCWLPFHQVTSTDFLTKFKPHQDYYKGCYIHHTPDLPLRPVPNFHRPPATPGCKRCGAALTKLTRIEIFDPVDAETAKNIKRDWKQRSEFPPEGYWLFLATEVHIITLPSSPYTIERQRIASINPSKTAAHLDIVRGYKIIPLPPPPRVGITNLPYDIIRRILHHLSYKREDFDCPVYLSPDAPVELFPIVASYLFMKSLGNVNETVQSMFLEQLREPWSLFGGYHPYPIYGSSDPAFNTTEVFAKGQLDCQFREEKWAQEKRKLRSVVGFGSRPLV
ncbi:hypothetical protein TWF694_011424 [Orbilia ellipsospora]|uniref:Uncharacterized protein n=1 Tax=Orbilia ellipsospora TaxID=2528407 RepID=A0AAV9XBE9_9PEZI